MGETNNNVMVCKVCGYTDEIFFRPDGNTEILNPTICTECGGNLINTNKTYDFWEEEYIKQHPKINVSELTMIDVFNWVAELYLKEDPEALAELDNRKAEQKAFLDEIMRTPRCPKCGSSNLGRAKQGFKWGRAVAGAAITGFLDVGAAAGAIGSGKMVNVCNQCGHKWK